MINQARLAHAVQALRSGRWTQTQGMLAWPVEYDATYRQHCCLGVLTEIAILCDPTVATALVRNTRKNFPAFALWASMGNLAAAVQNWYGFDDGDPFILLDTDEESGPVMASHANDGMGLSFSRIADAFERTYLTGHSEEEL